MLVEVNMHHICMQDDFVTGHMVICHPCKTTTPSKIIMVLVLRSTSRSWAPRCCNFQPPIVPISPTCYYFWWPHLLPTMARHFELNRHISMMYNGFDLLHGWYFMYAGGAPPISPTMARLFEVNMHIRMHNDFNGHMVWCCMGLPKGHLPLHPPPLLLVILLLQLRLHGVPAVKLR